MSRHLHLALLDTLADWEVGYLTAHLAQAGGDVDLVTVSADGAPVTTMGGLRVAADLALPDLDPADSAMLVLPGGEAWGTEVGQAFVTAAARFLAAGTPVAAICGATFALAAAGLLDERRHTSNDPGYLASSGYAGSHLYVAEPAVTDGDLVTASGIAPVHFAREVFARLGTHPDVVLDPWTRLYADREPEAFGELMALAGDHA